MDESLKVKAKEGRVLGVVGVLPLEDLRRGESPFWSLLEWEGQMCG